MDSDVSEKKAAIKKVYPKSMYWSYKVDEMSSAQITAIYLRFKAQGKV